MFEEALKGGEKTTPPREAAASPHVHITVNACILGFLLQRMVIPRQEITNGQIFSAQIC